MNKFNLFILVICIFLLANIAFADGGISNKWRIEVDGGANSDGEMIFHVIPYEGSTIAITVTVKDGTGENRVAKTIRNAFKEQLPKNHFHIEVDDGEDVLVKKKFGGKSFALLFVSSTVKHTEIELVKE